MSDIKIAIDPAAGTDFTGLAIHHNGRLHVYTGKTANAIIAAMNEWAANHMVKMQQAMNDAVATNADGHQFDLVKIADVREHVTGYATKLRKGEV